MKKILQFTRIRLRLVSFVMFTGKGSSQQSESIKNVSSVCLHGSPWRIRKCDGLLLLCVCGIAGNKVKTVVEEWKTNLMSLAILFHLLCAQNVSDINISIIRSLRLYCWITTSVVLFSVRCVLELLLRLVFGGVRFAGFSQKHEHHSKPAAPNLQHTTNWEQDDRCGNSSTQSQAPEDGYIKVRNMLST